MDAAFHDDTHDVEEHGERWVVCNACGAQWHEDGVEQIAEGDGSCEDRRAREDE